MSTTDGGGHILQVLQFPDRYERLFALLGPDVVRALIEPAESTRTALEAATLAIKARGEGLFVPIAGETGAGKTTLASSLTNFFPREFAPTALITGPIDYDALNAAVDQVRTKLPANDDRIVPVNIDHRESSPPTHEELANLKRFMRAPSRGCRAVLFWPEVNETIAREMGAAYQRIAGRSPIELPLFVVGPPRELWREIANNTLRLANSVTALEELGVNPADYDPAEFPTLGEFLRRVSTDFLGNLQRMLAETRKPVSVAILFVSESYDAGILTQLTNSTRLGLLDSHALVEATSDSRIGKWWSARMSALTTTIFKLNARAYCMPPACVIAVLRQHGASEVCDRLDKLGIAPRSDAKVAEYLGRTDVGRFLLGKTRGTYETRGKPPEEARQALSHLAKDGYTAGRDKLHNKAMRSAFEQYLTREGGGVVPPGTSVHGEEKLPFCELIPDNWIDRGTDVVCLEYTWRTGDFLTKGNRSTIAQYILEKLKDYAAALGWVVP